MDMVVCASHSHVLYIQCNEFLYFKLEETCRGTKYADSLTTLRKDGRGGWYALKHQYDGKDKGDTEVKRTTAILHTRKWRGNSSNLLDLFVSLHRTAFVAMQAAAEHVDFQLPNGNSRVGYLLDGIEYEDAAL